MTSTLPEELCGDPDDYKSSLGPGSYSPPRLFEGETYRRSPSFSMGVRYSLKGHYIEPGQGTVGYGNDSPGVGKYQGELTENSKGAKIGTGPKCPDSNFHLPAISPGPAYSDPNYKSISSGSAKGRSVSLKIFCVGQTERTKKWIDIDDKRTEERADFPRKYYWTGAICAQL